MTMPRRSASLATAGRPSGASLGVLVAALSAALLGTISVRPGPARAGEPSAKEIIRRATDQQAFRASGIEMQILMRLRNSRGETRDRTLFARAKRQGDLSRTLVRFLAPADVAGTSFLFIEHRGRDDDQYMYLPALKVVRRIVGSQKSSSFMGSDLTYADMEWRALEDASYRKQPDETIGNKPCHVIDAVPHQRDSYARLRAWIRKHDNAMLRLQFFDPHGKLLKVLYVKQLQRVDKMLMATQMKISNKQTGHTTLFSISNIRPRDDMADDDFTVRALKKR